MLLELANIGYQVGALGIVAFTLVFLVVVRWWTDHLGRVIAGVLSSMSAVLVITTLRMLNPELALDTTFLTCRMIVFWVFGVGVWIALASFIWSQFFAPRLRGDRSRMTTRKEFRNEEVGLADSRYDRHGDFDHGSGRPHG